MRTATDKPGKTLPVSDEQHELNRIAVWPLTSRAVRIAVLSMAGLPRDRANDGLESFTADERRRIATAAHVLMTDAGMIHQCAFDRSPRTVALAH
jgi:hypothetical protein